MFYVKTEIAEGVTIRAEITDKDVFTICPDCGVEHQVDLADAVGEDGRLDLFGTVVCCASCTEKHLHPKEQNSGRGLHFDKWWPAEDQHPRLLAYFKENYKGCHDNCGPDDEQTAEALELYHKVQRHPLWNIKEDIQEHFAEMFSAAGGCPEAVYDQELCELIELTVCPDPPREEE